MSSNEVANQIVNILALLGGEAGLTSIPTLREVIGAPGKTFDAAIGEIRNVIAMHDHDNPSRMSPQAKKEAFYDPDDGKYYVGIHLLNIHSAKSRKRDLALVTEIIREILYVLGPERGVVPIPALKYLLGVGGKKMFDKAMLDLQEEGEVELYALPDPHKLSEDGQYYLVDGKYIGISKT